MKAKSSAKILDSHKGHQSGTLEVITYIDRFPSSSAENSSSYKQLERPTACPQFRLVNSNANESYPFH